MVSYGQELDWEKLKENFERAVELIDQTWIKERREEEYENENRDHKHGPSPHPLVSKYNRGRIELYDEELDAPELFGDSHYSSSTHELVVIGEHLRHLPHSNIINKSGEIVSENVSDHLRPRLQNTDEWRDVSAEIEAAALYAREGYNVDFIEEGQSKAPDLRISGQSSIDVECKRCSRVTQADQKHGGLHEAIKKSIKSQLEREGIIIVYIDRTPSGEEAHNISKALPENTNSKTSHRIEIPFGKILIIPFKNPGQDKPVEKHPPSAADTPIEFFKKYVGPSISEQLNHDLELDDFRSKGLEAQCHEEENDFYLEGPVFFGILHDSDDNRVKQILRQFNKASGKFSKSGPNILHLKIPFLNELTYEEFEELKHRIGGKLNISSSISGVVISWHEIQVDSDGSITYGTVVGNVENFSPTEEFPSWFELPGKPLPKLADILKFDE